MTDVRAALALAGPSARAEDDDAPVPRDPRRAPRDRALDALAKLLPPDLLALVPDKWELLGDVLVLRLPGALRPHERAVASALADALGARAVVADDAGVAGEYREMRGRLLLGDDPVATHVENGVRFRLDASRVMFSSGNVHERTRTAAVDARGETVVDMFAGIGYFTLPLAVHAGPARIHAIEKNPLAHRFLVENVVLNGVERIVEPWLGDNREFPLDGVADRVLMGYFPGTARFLPKAMALLKPGGGRVHYHDSAHAESWREEMTRALLDAARGCGRVVRVEEARVVKTHSPGVAHAVVVARVMGP
ncbi:MAG TPA: class I SAM-dependent methyltransferase family protein [Candidatus Thermoplasmatota archaeon]|nr:class I SAM-dependent methyltransferase family protein [Candidatus Thermoplasmatota archaeon]